MVIATYLKGGGRRFKSYQTHHQGGIQIAVDGGLAQLGEHLLCKQGVVGSIPSSSTIIKCQNKALKQCFVLPFMAVL